LPPTQRGELPRVVIVGRPNVGKSTLFNRLTRTRRAITDPRPGVTRDPIEQVTRIGGRTVVLVDTGGVADTSDTLDRAVRGRTVDQARRADLVLLVLDVADLTPQDERFVEALRPLADRTVLVANKADNDDREILGEHHRLGFRRVVAVSATNGRNWGALEAVVSASLPQPSASEAEPVSPSAPAGDALCLAILGKPNTGKSTLLNRLVGQERALVSEVPGTTRDVVEGSFQFGQRRCRVLDTAGIRRKGSVSSSVEVFSIHRAIRSVESADVVLLLIDSSNGVSDQDKKIASVVVKRGRGIIICLNKWDLLERVGNRLQAVTDRVRFLFPVVNFAPILPLSAKNGYGVDAILQTAARIRDQLDVRVPTSQLNRALECWMERYPVPAHGRNVRIRFAAQKGLRPSTFVCHVNTRKSFPRGYLRYVENKIREDFGLDMIPIRMELEEE
jgi:GTP-binding protein